jgi:hypothetical protein
MINNRKNIKQFTEKDYIRELRQSTIAKFTQNPTLYHKLDILKILENDSIVLVFENKYMRNILAEITKTKLRKPKEFVVRDIPLLTLKKKRIVKKYTKVVCCLLFRIKKLEGVDFHPEMIEDSLLILYPGHKKLVKQSQQWSKNSILSTTLPNFLSLVRYIRKKEPKLQYHLQTASFLLFFFNKYDTFEINIPNTNNPEYKLKNIKLPKIHRPYRCEIPDEILKFKEISPPSSEKTITNGKKKKHNTPTKKVPEMESVSVEETSKETLSPVLKEISTATTPPVEVPKVEEIPVFSKVQDISAPVQVEKQNLDNSTITVKDSKEEVVEKKDVPSNEPKFLEAIEIEKIDSLENEENDSFIDTSEEVHTSDSDQ